MKRLATFLVTLAIAAVVYFNFYSIIDAVKLYNYSPSKEVVTMADDTTMTPKARKIFYANHPQFAEKSAFRKDCTVEEQSIVLGCYINSKGIYVLRVDDPRLSGVMQVTTAHETMHAVYDRLSSSERKKIDTLTAEAYKNMTNQRIQKNVEAYRKQDAKIVPNELHSILASEVSDLPPELEAHYAKYFTNRAKIVQYSKNYEQAFVSVQSQVDDYDKQMQTLKTTIDANEKQLDALGAELSAQRSALERRIASGQGDSINSEIESFNSKVSKYNSLLNTTKDAVESYNAIVEKRNSAVTEEKDLVQKINANYDTINQAGGR